MPYLPLSQAIADRRLQAIRLIATDMDGTLTTHGKFTSHLLRSLEQLAEAGIPVIIVTGRSAGWVNGLASYLPIWGAIAENGGVFCPADPEKALTILPPIADVTLHRQRLASVFRNLQEAFPHLQPSVDNRFRMTDWTFDLQNLSPEDLQQLDSLCQKEGWGFTYSTVQCHIKLPSQDKAVGLTQILQTYFPDYGVDRIVTVGDSPNDESLFDAEKFPCSVGVANSQDYANQMVHQPAYVTIAPEAAGFCELASYLQQVSWE